MASDIVDRPVRPLTADEVIAMVQAGILSEAEPVELLLGQLRRKMTKNPPHCAVMTRLNRWLVTGTAADRYDVRPEGAMRVPDRTSLPEPDLVVVAHTDLIEHPTTALLAIEIAESSLRTDTRVKSVLYAGAAIPEYWVVDVARTRVIVFDALRDGGYARQRTLEPDAKLCPQHVDIEALALADLFRGLERQG